MKRIVIPPFFALSQRGKTASMGLISAHSIT
jgi:hypothetical protein